MKITRSKLANLPMVYAVGTIRLDDRFWCLAASEAEGGDYLLIDPESGQHYLLEGLSGGIMSLVPIPEEPWAFLVIQKFYPIFRSEAAEIAHVKMSRPDTNGHIACTITKVIDLPYVHRIMLYGESDNRRIIAATLCSKKDSIEDWSSAGGVYAISYPIKEDSEPQVELVIAGIHRNHGLFESKVNRDCFYVAGDEGVFELRSVNGIWLIRKIISTATSDVSFGDVDHDGEEELLTIQPFHGTEMNVFKFQAGEWNRILHQELSFGHVLWSGKMFGRTYFITGSRSGDQALKLYTQQRGQHDYEYQEIVLDQGTAPSQISVAIIREDVTVFAANHDAGEVVSYQLTTD